MEEYIANLVRAIPQEAYYVGYLLIASRFGLFWPMILPFVFIGYALGLVELIIVAALRWVVRRIWLTLMRVYWFFRGTPRIHGPEL